MVKYFVSPEGFEFKLKKESETACLYRVKFFDEYHYEVFKNTGSYPDNDKIMFFKHYDDALKIFEKL